MLRTILKGVSRSFYLTLRILPAAVREPISLAYLLARAADTLADTRAVTASRRSEYLGLFDEQVQGLVSMERLEQLRSAVAAGLENPDEQRLLACLPELFILLALQSSEDRRLIRTVVQTLVGGMRFDLETFPPEEQGGLEALVDEVALERYTYQVAGCVGEFWTRISCARIGALRGWDVEHYSSLGIKFGQALQLTNILRDLPRDLRIGRCYLPQPALAAAGLSAADLLEAGNSAAAWSLLVARIKMALAYYQAGEEYLLGLPRRCVRLRLAALWPLAIGLGTLARLAANPAWLDPGQTIKVKRAWVYRMMLISILLVPFDSGLRGWLAQLRRRVEGFL